MLHLKEANGRLESLLSEEGKSLEGAFVNLVDPYVVMDLTTKVLSMNSSAKEFLGYDNEKEDLILSDLVHKDYLEYTAESFQRLLQVGILKNYNAQIFTKKYGLKYVNINASLIYNKNGNPVAAQGVIRDITADMEVKKLMESQKQQLDLIFENSSLGIILIVKGKIIKANRAFCDMLNYQEFELKNMSLEDISTIEDISQYQALLDMEESSSDKITITRIFHQKNGDSLYGKTSLTNVYNNLGQVEYNVVMVDDITSEKEATDMLAASESRMTTMIGNLQSGVLLEDVNRKLLKTNQKFKDLFGIPPELGALKGLDCKSTLHQWKEKFKDPEQFILGIDRAIHERRVVIADELELNDGRVFSRDYIPLFNDDEPIGHLWTYSDITIQKNYRRNIEQQKEKYSNIIANMNLGLVEVDNDGKILLVNNRYCQMIGLNESELIGKDVLELMNMDDENLSLVQSQLERRKKSESDSYQIQITNQNNEKKYWLISGGPTYDDLGKVIGSVGVHLDVTRQRELELQKESLVKELEESNKGLQEYAHIVSHDLKSPLRSVSALVDWLCQDYKDKLDENGMYNLKMIQDKIEGMDNLIGGILKYSTVNSNSLENVDVDVNEIISGISDIIYIPDHVTIKTKETLPTIKADPTMMHQLFQNFLSNAVVHIDKEEGVVEVGCKDLGTHWQFSIADNGVGIPKEYHEKIFKIFQSIGNKERSTGIGLSIVKKIIERYKGKVWLESEIGQGTTFHFTIIKKVE
ncbi:PAS domain S-box protein [Muricauda sp. DJ-13]|uniref:histidine kinase n=2 Tax=Croceivirga thetidis TaxID=2721623 RepID=A0ABX1GMD2_9FLAO|nr:PAS domain S-box protein [Croceivirga thetidis]